MWIQKFTKVDGEAVGKFNGPFTKKLLESMLKQKYVSYTMETGRYGTYLIGYPKPTLNDALMAFSGSRSLPDPEVWKVIYSMAGGRRRSKARGKSRRTRSKSY